jgi:hypothetical protein
MASPSQRHCSAQLVVTNHKTAWALDVVLKDIDPVAIQRKEATEIPAMVEHLMEKHFMGPDGTYFPDTLPLDGSAFGIRKPAARALYTEILADMKINGWLPLTTPANTNRLVNDVQARVSHTISSYANFAPPQTI